jgi:hypothetical protein
MQVHILTEGAGDFETSSAGQPYGVRTFGFWSLTNVQINDLVIIRRPTKNALYKITEVKHDFTGSDDNMYWSGVMSDVIALNLMTKEIEHTIQQVRIPA